jgi:hypothetical protein
MRLEQHQLAMVHYAAIADERRACGEYAQALHC